MSRPLCFVLMPCGRKPDVSGRIVDFELVYRGLIAPAVEQAGLEPLRADAEMTGGINHTPMLERLILCEYAVADLTTANANVFYELGVRHAVRRSSTVLLFAAGGSQLPFDIAPLGALPYTLAPDGGPADVVRSRAALTKRLSEARDSDADSPIYQLVDGFPDVQRLKTDVFRHRVRYAEVLKAQLAKARTAGADAVRAAAASLGPLADVESGVVVDLFLSYRSVKAWNDMIALVDRMPRPLAKTVMIQEQLGLALNRAGRSDEAERVLLDLIAQRGPSSETCGILGRVYKDRWDAAVKRAETMLARELLEKAITAYLMGFEADWRDAYPGINAVTLMELQDQPDPRRLHLLPVVRYAVERRMAAGEPDYWDYATLIELAVLAGDRPAAESSLADALARVRESWEAETTARNLALIRETRERRGTAVPWALAIETPLLRAAASR